MIKNGDHKHYMVEYKTLIYKNCECDVETCKDHMHFSREAAYINSETNDSICVTTLYNQSQFTIKKADIREICE